MNIMGVMNVKQIVQLIEYKYEVKFDSYNINMNLANLTLYTGNRNISLVIDENLFTGKYTVNIGKFVRSNSDPDIWDMLGKMEIFTNPLDSTDFRNIISALCPYFDWISQAKTRHKKLKKI